MLVNCRVQFNIVGLQPELVDDNFEICRVASIRGLQEETVGSLVKGHLKTRLWRPVRESVRAQTNLCKVLLLLLPCILMFHHDDSPVLRNLKKVAVKWPASLLHL